MIVKRTIRIVVLIVAVVLMLIALFGGSETCGYIGMTITLLDVIA